MNNNNVTELLDIKKLFRMYWHNILKIIFWVILGGVVFYLYAQFAVTPEYTAQSEILVNQKASNDQFELSQQQADFKAIGTYKDVLTKSVILQPAAQELAKKDNFKGGSAGIGSALSISNKSDSQVITIKTIYKNPYVAADMANAVASAFSNKIPKMMKVDNVTIVSGAKANPMPVSPRKNSYARVGMIVGLLLSVIVYTLRFMLDTRIKSEDFFTNELGSISLGQVSHIDNKNDYHHLVGVISGQSDDEHKRV